MNNQIKFEKVNYEALFLANDGDLVIVTNNRGDTITRKVKYIDDTHFMLDNSIYHTHQFAEIMAHNGSKVALATQYTRNKTKGEEMNKQRRRAILTVIDQLENIEQAVNDIQYEEQE